MEGTAHAGTEDKSAQSYAPWSKEEEGKRAEGAREERIGAEGIKGRTRGVRGEAFWTERWNSEESVVRVCSVESGGANAFGGKGERRERWGGGERPKGDCSKGGEGEKGVEREDGRLEEQSDLPPQWLLAAAIEINEGLFTGKKNESNFDDKKNNQTEEKNKGTTRVRTECPLKEDLQRVLVEKEGTIKYQREIIEALRRRVGAVERHVRILEKTIVEHNSNNEGNVLLLLKETVEDLIGTLQIGPFGREGPSQFEPQCVTEGIENKPYERRRAQRNEYEEEEKKKNLRGNGEGETEWKRSSAQALQMFPGPYDALIKQMAATRQKAEEFETRERALRAEVESLKSRERATRFEIGEMSELLQKLQAQGEEDRKRREEAEKAKEEAESEVRKMKASAEVRPETQLKVMERNVSMQSMRMRIQHLTQRVSSSEEALKEAKKEVEALHKTNHAFKTRLNRSEAGNLHKQAIIDNYKSQNKELENRKSEAEEQKKCLESEMQFLRESILHLKKQVVGQKNSLSASEKENVALKEELECLTKRINEKVLSLSSELQRTKESLNKTEAMARIKLEETQRGFQMTLSEYEQAIAEKEIMVEEYRRSLIAFLRSMYRRQRRAADRRRAPKDGEGADRETASGDSVAEAHMLACNILNITPTQLREIISPRTDEGAGVNELEEGLVSWLDELNNLTKIPDFSEKLAVFLAEISSENKRAEAKSAC